MRPAVLYNAKSDEDKKGSIGTQLQDGRRHAAGAGLTVAGEFSEDDKTAWKGNRGPKLIAAMDLCERLADEHGSCTLIVQHSDRLARGDGKRAKHLLHYMLWAVEHDVALVSVQDPQALTSFVMGAVAGDQNEAASSRKSASVRDGHERRARDHGLHPGGPRPYAYEYQRYMDGRVIPDTALQVVRVEAALFVEHIWTPARQGASSRDICQQLNALGIPSSTGRRWHPSAIIKVLANPLYAGKHRRVRDGAIFDGAHDAIVDWDEWQEFQRTRRGSNGGGGPAKGGRKPNWPALFTNRHLRCGSCGHAMGPRSRPNRASPDSAVYVCAHRAALISNCDQRPVDLPAVEQAAIRALLGVTGSAAAEGRAQTRERRADVELTEAQLDDAHRLLLQNRTRRERVETDYLDGSLPADLYQRANERLTSEGAAAAAQVEQLERRAAELRERVADLDVEHVMRATLEALAGTIRAGLADSAALGLARTQLRAAFPVVKLHEVAGRLWIDLGTPDPAWVSDRIDDELADRHAGEPVLRASATTDHNVLTTWSVVAEVEL